MPDQIIVSVVTEPQAVAVQVELGVKGDPGLEGLQGPNGVDQVSATPPVDPVEGDRWFSSVTGLSYTFFDGVWVSNSAGSAYVPHAASHAADGGDPITPASIGAAAAAHTHAIDSLSDVTAPTPSIGDTLVWSGTAWVSQAGGGGGVTEHGALTGLGDDDHTQYALANGSRGSFAAVGHNHAGVYDPAGTASAAVSGHMSATDPHGDRAYAESLVVGLLDDRGNFDASINTFPTTGGSGPSGAILKGDLWTISVVATGGPLLGYNVSCVLRALVDAPGQTVGNWAINAVGYGYSPENVVNKSITLSADQASDTKYPTVKSVYDWATGFFLASASFTASNIRSLLGITTLSGSNTGDQDLSGLASLSGDQTIGGNKTFSGDTAFSGSMSAKGSAGEVQYNNGGVIAGAADIEVEGGQLRLPVIADPATPAASGLKLYGTTMANRVLPKIIDPDGFSTTLQPGLQKNSIIIISPSSGTNAPTVIGASLTTAATVSMQYNAAGTTRWDTTLRKRFQTSTTAGNASSCRTNYAVVARSATAGCGGFYYRAQVGASLNLNGGQKFCGLTSNTNILGAEPTALVNMIGVGYDSTDPDTGNWFFMSNDGSGAATKVNLGASAARATLLTNFDALDVILYNPPGSGTFYVRISTVNNGTVLLNASYDSDVPPAGTGLAIKCDVRNGAVAAQDNIEFSKIYMEYNF